jgi:hypothetical protein
MVKQLVNAPHNTAGYRALKKKKDYTRQVGKAIVKCPKNGREVVLHEDCVNCEFFEFWGSEDARPYVVCKDTQRT